MAGFFGNTLQEIMKIANSRAQPQQAAPQMPNMAQPVQAARPQPVGALGPAPQQAVRSSRAFSSQPRPTMADRRMGALGGLRGRQPVSSAPQTVQAVSPQPQQMPPQMPQGSPFGRLMMNQGAGGMQPGQAPINSGGFNAAMARIMSDVDTKTDIAPAEDDVLERLRRVPVSTYRYREEHREAIGDDGRRRIGPMSQDWSAEFGGPEKTIAMPQVIGVLLSAVKALDKRTETLAGA